MLNTIFGNNTSDILEGLREPQWQTPLNHIKIITDIHSTGYSIDSLYVNDEFIKQEEIIVLADIIPFLPIGSIERTDRRQHEQ